MSYCYIRNIKFCLCFLVTGQDDAKRSNVLEQLNDGKNIDLDFNDPALSNAAVKIQSQFRGYKTRKEFDEMKKENVSSYVDVDDPKQQKAAIVIQAGYRGHKVRSERKNASKSIQVGYNDSKTKTEATDKVQEDFDVNKTEIQHAATVIQAGYRGYKSRQEVAMLQKIKSKGEHLEAKEAGHEGHQEHIEAKEVGHEGPLENIEAKEADHEEHEKCEEHTETKEAGYEVHQEYSEAKEAGHEGHLEHKEAKEAGYEEYQEHIATNEVDGEIGLNDEELENVENFRTDYCEDVHLGEIKKEEIDGDFTDPEVQNAVITLQAGFRGFKARKELKGAQEVRV